jgi:hypothetical protein
MADFTVEGPFKVPFYQGKASRVIRAEDGRAFFRKHPAFARRRGVYVFAVRSGGGITPAYVGSATGGFASECFQPHKIGKCNEALADYARGTLVLFFVSAAEKGKAPGKQIKLVEDFLIQAGISVNPDLLNVKGTQQARWRITGVIRAKQGKPSKAARALRSAFKL